MGLTKKRVEEIFLKCIEEDSFLGYTENRLNKGKETGKSKYTSRGKILWNIKKVRLKKW